MLAEAPQSADADGSLFLCSASVCSSWILEIRCLPAGQCQSKHAVAMARAERRGAARSGSAAQDLQAPARPPDPRRRRGRGLFVGAAEPADERLTEAAHVRHQAVHLGSPHGTPASLPSLRGRRWPRGSEQLRESACYDVPPLPDGSALADRSRPDFSSEQLDYKQLQNADRQAKARL